MGSSMKESGRAAAIAFMKKTGVGATVGEQYNLNDSFSKVVGGVLQLVSIEKGKISCLLTVKPPILNGAGVLLGAVVAAVAERLAIACAATQTIINGDPHHHLGEITISYLSAALPNEQLAVDASVIKSGKNLTVVAVDFRLKESQRLAYVSRATVYNHPPSKI